MTLAHEYAQQHQERFLNELQDLLRIPSVSAMRQEHTADVKRAAEWIVRYLQQIEMHTVELIEIENHHPLIYADWMGAGEDAPTILIYGHYDVQPAMMEDGWDTPPFEPVLKDGKLYARGTSDDKGQLMAQVYAVESLIQTGSCPVNIKMLFEGEEEVSSGALHEYVPTHQEKLAADVCVISDTAIYTEDQPSIVYALRGIIYFQIDLHGPTADLHSGGFGGAVHNPLQVLSEMLASLHNADGSVNIPGFYDDVLPLSEAERTKLQATNVSEETFRAMTGVPQSWGEPDYTLSERVGARPTLEIHGILGGFVGEGPKTVLPAHAMAKVSCRLVANQNPNHILKLVEDHIRSITPPTVTITLQPLGSVGFPSVMGLDHPSMQAAHQAYTKGWGKEPYYVRSGGSIPIVEDFQQNLNVPVIMLGFGLSTDGIHGPNEHWCVSMFYKGIDTAIHFLQEMATIAQ